MTDRRVISHVLRRLTPGPTATEIDAGVSAGLEATVDRVLAPVPPPALPALGADPLTSARTKEERQEARRQVAEQVADATWWWIGRLAGTGSSAAEKLTFFWHGHWATSVQKVRSAGLMLSQQQIFRRYGTGATGPLVRAMLRDPALIIWLDGQRNTRKAPNENLAREVMELFTLGVGHYTEDDVKAAAKVLTGWQVDRAAGTARLVAARHDPAAVTLLGTTGVFGVDEFADMLVRHPAHVPFLASRVRARYGSAPDLETAGNNVTAMLRALALDASFPADAGNLGKQPIEWVVGAVRQLDVPLDKARKPALAALRALGQVPFRPPSVGGWPAGEAWLTTAAAQARLRSGQALAALAPAAVQSLSETKGERLDALARLLAVDAWTDRTAAVLKPVAAKPQQLLALALATPEYTVH
ncbi:DUF1800 domain-containing protein [Paractinoplanes toevensis]|uniref:DUF1800 domain-containing protein n=1 Tax=Paractinoplanes toevensis TaxID=571911 RepID=A0A919TBW6_9ACTN|nr:DUF1800 domain-containing protein [Actinoplanes toevensis]GIM93159.1 hypothetical protein Ato02nite_049520 [Actinoplanes toevensis]